CTAGASYGMCAAGVAYSEAALLQAHQSLQNAADWGARGDGGKGACNPFPAFGCGQNLTVYWQGIVSPERGGAPLPSARGSRIIVLRGGGPAAGFRSCDREGRIERMNQTRHRSQGTTVRLGRYEVTKLGVQRFSPHDAFHAIMS